MTATSATMAHCSSSSLNPSLLFSNPNTLPQIPTLFTLSAIRSPQLRFYPLSSTHRSSVRRLPVVSGTLTVDSPTSYAGDKHGKKLLLEVKDLTAVIAESQQTILNGVNLTVFEGEVRFFPPFLLFRLNLRFWKYIEVNWMLYFIFFWMSCKSLTFKLA